MIIAKRFAGRKCFLGGKMSSEMSLILTSKLLKDPMIQHSVIVGVIFTLCIFNTGIKIRA